jgi:23S rRNA (uracil1939-C5)-methyltransferase
VSSSDVIELTVERPAVGGRMIARHDGRVVLVGGTIPGERIRAAVERSRRDVVLARTIEVLEPSPDRRPAAFAPECGGRSFAHIDYRRQLELKSEIVRDAYRRIGRIELSVPLPVIPSPETGYRMRARLHVGEGKLGFLEEGSHRVCDVAGTGQLLPATEQLIAELAAHVDVLTSIGARTVELAQNLAGDQCAVHVVMQSDPVTVGRRLRALASVGGVTGFTAAGGRGPRDRVVLAGTSYVSDALSAFVPSGAAGSLSLRRHADAFFQANRYLAPELVSMVAGLTERTRVVDLYAGVGLFAVSVAATRGGPVTAVERDPCSIGDLVSNAAQVDPDVQVVRAPVETFLKRSANFDGAAVIVDPPRTGLSREAVTRLARRRPDRIVYVSCDVATQARDLRALGASGYQLDQVHVFDMFPNTPHIETVVALER